MDLPVLRVGHDREHLSQPSLPARKEEVMADRLTARVLLTVDVDTDSLIDSYVAEHKESPPANRYMRETVLREHLRLLVLDSADAGIRRRDLDAAVSIRPTGT